MEQINNPTITPTATLHPTKTAIPPALTLFPTETSEPFSASPEASSTPLVISTEQQALSSELNYFKTCPVMLASNRTTFLSEGSILYATGKVDESSLFFFSRIDHSDVLAFSVNNSDPIILYAVASEQDIRVSLSPDGMRLLRFAQNQTGESEYVSVVYDLVTREEIYVSQPQPFSSGEWLLDGRIKYLVSHERQFREGENYEFLIFDPATHETQSLIITLSLPNYHFYEEPSYEGIASMDPTGELVLYTTRGADVTSDVALRNIKTDTNIWYQEGSSGVGYSYPMPEWTVDGSNVLFSMSVSEGDQNYNKIFSLTRDGQDEELPPQPYPLLDELNIRGLSYSPDRQFIHYSTQETLVTGAGFIVDIANSWVGEICDDMSTFIEGQWVTEGQFVYKVLLENGGQALRLLDITTWTVQTLSELPTGQGFLIFGWTPLEFEQP